MSETTEPNLIEEVEALLAKATPGPWAAFRGLLDAEGVWVMSAHIEDAVLASIGMDMPEAEGNAKLIATAPDLLRRLVEEVKRLRAEAVSLRERERKQLGTVIEIRGCDKCDLCEDHQ